VPRSYGGIQAYGIIQSSTVSHVPVLSQTQKYILPGEERAHVSDYIYPHPYASGSTYSNGGDPAGKGIAGSNEPITPFLSLPALRETDIRDTSDGNFQRRFATKSSETKTPDNPWSPQNSTSYTRDEETYSGNEKTTYRETGDLRWETGDREPDIFKQKSSDHFPNFS
jgi:hypothetical protein